MGKTSIICITPTPSRKGRNREWSPLKSEYRKELEKLKVLIIENAPYALENSVLEYNKWNIPTINRIVKEVLYCYGAGMKVAIQITFITISGGYIEPNQDVIAVGGIGKGADCAIVLKANYPEFPFSEDSEETA